MTDRLGALVIGSGAAGLAFALEAGRRGIEVAVITKDELGTSTSEYAQGGIAAVLDEGDDSTGAHLEDTLRAGVGLCDVSSVRVLVDAAPSAIAELVADGAVFDLDGTGRFARSREGGHSGARVVHAGGAATGAEVVRALRETGIAEHVRVLEGRAVADLVVEDGCCTGVSLLDGSGGVSTMTADAVVLATGGAGQCFSLTTNPLGATADGLAMALRAGAVAADLEFVQFHPTALVTDTIPRPLLSEALRGDGALLLDRSGRRFVDELQPRDVVSRAIAEQCARDGTDHVYLDARPIARFDERFPSLAAILAAVGLEAGRDLLPVAPAAHYLCGGVLTDLDGRTSLPGLYAIGEVACTGVHGANRLASNSLLEGLVFGRRCAIALATGGFEARPGALGGLEGAPSALPVERFPLELPAPRPTGAPGPVEAARARLQQVMTEGAGVRRSAESLELAHKDLTDLAAEHLGPSRERAGAELANLAAVSLAIVAAAAHRHESRGAHTRTDYPDRDDSLRVRYAPLLTGAPGSEARR